MRQKHFRQRTRWPLPRAAAIAVAIASLLAILSPGGPPAYAQPADEALRRAANSPTPTSTKTAWNALLRRSAQSTRSAKPATISELASLLEPGEALVRIAGYLPGPDAPRAFVALVQTAEQPGPILLKLAPDLDTPVRAWEALITQDPRQHPDGAAASEAVAGKLAEDLRRSIWDPIATLFEKPGTILYATDPELPLLPFEAFPQYDGSLLIETAWRFHQLARESELRTTGLRDEPMGTGLCVLSRPDFEETTVFGSALAGLEDLSGSAPSPLRTIECLRSAVEGHTFEKSTSHDVADACLRIWRRPASWWKFWSGDDPVDWGNVVELKASRASERHWKSQAPSHRILILATRAFDARVRNQCENADASDLCGLAMSGANHALVAEGPDEDAILFASELSNLPLHGTDWVVLPEIGSDVPGHTEPLVGSFVRAGCRSALYTAWEIHQKWVEPALTEAFEAHYRREATTIDALTQGRLAALDRIRQERGSSHPYYWTALRLRGNWR